MTNKKYNFDMNRLNEISELSKTERFPLWYKIKSII